MKKGLSSNVIKLIAVIIVIVDHIGFYFARSLNYNEYIVLRAVRKDGNANFYILYGTGLFLHKKLKKIYFENIYFSCNYSNYSIYFRFYKL